MTEQTNIRATTRALCEALDMLIDSLAESVAAYEVARRKIEALTKADDAPLYHVRGEGYTDDAPEM